MEMSSGISRCVPVLTIILSFFYHQQLFSILSLHSWKSLHVNILYIKGKFHLFSKFCNCQCERSTCVTHAASNTHLILITPLWRLHSNSSQVFTWFFLMICLKLTIYARRRSWKYTGRHIVMFFPLSHWPPVFFFIWFTAAALQPFWSLQYLWFSSYYVGTH